MIVIVGVSHRTAPLSVREGLAFPRERLHEALRRARAETGASEIVIFSTCNRVEIVARENDGPAREALVSFLAGFHGRRREEIEPFVYRLAGEDAVRHAFRVAASLDSMVVGEPQILGQVKDAYQAAEDAGTLGEALRTLRNQSLAAAKRARTETGIGRSAVSVSYVAVELAGKIFGELRDKNVLLVGAGKMSALAARRLVHDGARATVLAGRTYEHAAELAASLGGRAAPFASLREEMARADIVISGTAAPGIVVRREDVEAAISVRHERPLFLIDIAVPRDVEPSARELPGVFLYDVDDLKAVAEANLEERRRRAEAAEAIVDRAARKFLAWQMSANMTPLIVELRRRGEAIRRAELERVRGRLGPLSPEQEEAVEALSAAIVNKLLHSPTVQLKEIAESQQAHEHVGLIRKLLGLQGRLVTP